MTVLLGYVPDREWDDSPVTGYKIEWLATSYAKDDVRPIV